MTFEREKRRVIAFFTSLDEQQSFRKPADCFQDICELIGYSHLQHAKSALEFLELSFKIFNALFDCFHYNLALIPIIGLVRD